MTAAAQQIVDGTPAPREHAAAPGGEYDALLGYGAEFLAALLCPLAGMCHQRFELVVDELAFVGHPVCAADDGAWRFAQERPPKATSRGRESRKGRAQSPVPAPPPQADDAAPASVSAPTTDAAAREPPSGGTWLQTFHFVIVLDLPDPSSSASGTPCAALVATVRMRCTRSSAISRRSGSTAPRAS